MFRCVRLRSDMLWVFCFFHVFFANALQIFAFVVAEQLLQICNTHDVRYVALRMQMALLLSFLGPPWWQWCSDWCALGCSATVASGVASVRRTFCGWLASDEVFAAVPLGSACFLSCWVGGYFVARWNVAAQAGCFIAAFGHRRPPRHARAARVLEVGGPVAWAQMQLTRKRHFWVFSKYARLRTSRLRQ